MNLPRVPEPAFLSPCQEAAEYCDMDHSEVNRRFVDDLIAGLVGTRVMDLGCGPACIPIELCERQDAVQILALDGEVEMLEIAKREVDIAGLLDRVTLHHADVCDMEAYEDAMADTVISNSMVHHLAEPQLGLRTMVRLVRPGGRLFVRDLARPATVEQTEGLVEQYCGEENENAQQLFRQSLHAALTIDEIRQIARGLGIADQHVQMTSDRHWTLDWCRPAE